MPESQKQIDDLVKLDGSVFVAAELGDRQEPSRHTQEVHENNPDKTVVVKGDKRLKYKDVRKVMRLINEAGFTRVGLVIGEEARQET